MDFCLVIVFSSHCLFKYPLSTIRPVCVMPRISILFGPHSRQWRSEVFHRHHLTPEHKTDKSQGRIQGV